MFVESRHDARGFFIEVWRKLESKAQLEPLQRVVAEVILQHPEYHDVLRDPDRALTADYGQEPESANPFLHMGLHIALVEQLQTDRPPGIRDLYQKLLAAQERDGMGHEVEHGMMTVLAEEMVNAGREGRMPDMERYLARLQEAAK